MVEQWTENPCVLGSTPRGTTSSFHSIRFPFLCGAGFFCFSLFPASFAPSGSCLLRVLLMVRRPWYPSRDGRRHVCMTVAVQSYGGRRTGNAGMPSWSNAVVRHLFAEGAETCKKVNVFDKNIISFMGKCLLFTRIPIFRYCVAVMFFLSLQAN